MPELAAVDAARSAAGGDAAGAAVAGVGMAVPDRVVENGPIAARLGVDAEWIASRTGVRERRIAADGELVYAYAARAAFAALAAAGADPAEIDLVLVATMSHDLYTPGAAPLVAAEIGAEDAGALDVGAACTGFLAALAMAVGQLESGRVGTALVIGADLLSPLVDRDDRGTAGLFADGAGAAVLRSVPAPGRVGPVVLGADGSRAGLIRASHAEGAIRMTGHDLFRQAVDRMSAATLDALAAAGRTIADVDLFVYHQANSRIIRAVGERLALPAERVADYVPRYGNTSAASIPLALAEAESEGRLREGATVLLAAFGAGLCWGACALEWGGADAG